MDTDNTTASSDIQDNVHLGVWTNWSRGPVLGVTITLTRDQGNLAIAFTTFFIGVVSSRFWKIACLSFHRLYSIPQPRDAVYHQRQAVLSNSADATAGAWLLIQLWWAWRTSATHLLKRILPLLLFATLCISGFAAASGFSSQIATSMGDEVLLSGKSCGIIYESLKGDPINLNGVAIIDEYASNLAASAEEYVRQCYGSHAKGISLFECNRFVFDKIPIYIDRNATCPFKKAEVCRKNSSNIYLETGELDSHTHLGLNAPQNDRFHFRTSYHCAPLKTDGYTSNYTEGPWNYTRYQYGDRLGDSADTESTVKVISVDDQYQINLVATPLTGDLDIAALSAQVVNGSFYPNSSSFNPGSDIYRSDGDIDIAFLVGNGILFDQRSDDDWYRATVVSANVTLPRVNGSKLVYRPEEAASPMGCVAQYQFCNPSLPKEPRCGPHSGIYDAAIQAGPLFGLTEDQITDYNPEVSEKTASCFLWFVNSLFASILPGQVLASLGSRALAPQAYLGENVRGPIRDNQWQLDVIHWWSTSLASIQLSVVNVATGPQSSAYNSTLLLPNPFQRKMCDNQKIRSTDYTSFSVLGLILVYVTGTLIIIISYLLEPIFDCLEKRRKSVDYRNLEWRSNQFLQLQRLGYSSLGRGTWSRAADSIPMTERGEEFESLALWKDSPITEDNVVPKKSDELGRSVTLVNLDEGQEMWQEK
ncbi:hypothetical protein GQ53DRAFT_825784 [Thozetella sp. PMI_491]|nr:hypothetical protein GQ53DRAFT_825784 [Thozetella sp. PMI_491]